MIILALVLSPFFSRAPLSSLFIFAAAVLCLLIPALYNSYPLVTSDSGAYINHGWTLEIPQDRPLGYSLFIRIASINGMTLWGVVVAQAIMLIFFMQLLAKHVLGENYNHYIFLAIVLLTGAVTSAGWFCGQIMPDIFTAILLFALYILFFIPVTKKSMQWLLYAFILFCIFVHNSNLLISIALGAVLLGYARWKKNTSVYKPAAALLIIGITGWILLSSMTAISGRGFRPSSATHVFIMSRMVENGILEAYLNRNCHITNYRLCEWRGKLPDRQWGFMWDNEGAFAHSGGWTGSEEEFKKIIKGTLTHPDYLWMHIWKNAVATLRQLPLLYVGDGLMPFGDPSNPYWKVQQYFSDELKEYTSSLQQTNGLKLTGFNVAIMLFALLVLAASLFVKGTTEFSSHRELLFTRLFKLTFLFILANAAITATFSTVVGRFQSRIAWVLVFLCMIYLVNAWMASRKRSSS